MVTSDDRIAALRAQAVTYGGLEWEDGADLSRLSVEAFRRNVEGGEYSPSTGRTRLTGPGVEGHSASLAATGRYLSAFQQLVTAVGAFLKGHRTVKGPIPLEVKRLTRLNLTAAPAQGSLIFLLNAGHDIAEERYPNGQGSLADEQGRVDALLVEQSMSRISELLAAALDREDPFVLGNQLEDLGPKVADAARVLADTMSLGGFDMELMWEPPGRPRIHASMKRASAKFLSEVVEGRDLDAEPVTVVGILRTVTDAQPTIHIDLDDGDRVAINRGGISIPGDFYHQRVIAEIFEKTREQPDGRRAVTRRLRSIALDEMI